MPASSKASVDMTPPPSPFFRPSIPEKVVVEQSVATPQGRNRRTRQVVVSTSGVVEHKSGLFGCAANMMATIVGSGIVGLPYAMANTGFVAGCALIVLCGVLTEKSLRLLVETAKHLHKQSYETAVEVPFGIIGFRFILINMFVMSYGAMVSYLMITKSSASYLWGVEEDMHQNFVLLFVSLMVQLPLACMRDMADLEKTSGIAVAIDCALVALVFFYSPWTKMEGMEQDTFWQMAKTDTVHTSTLFVGLGVLSFAFECQEAVFLVAGSLEKPTSRRWGQVTSMALCACVLLAITCAITGYLGYGEDTQGNILNNFAPDTLASFISQGLLGITMFATYPLASFVARHVCVVLLFESRAHEGGADSSILKRTDRRIVLTVTLYILALIPATVFTDMGVVLALAGVIGGSCLAYIGPGLLYLGVHGGRFLELADDFFKAPKENANEQTRQMASETTSLVDNSDSGDKESQRSLDGWSKTVLWYLGGMPLWTAIAELGHKRVMAHALSLTAKNTLEHNRIGGVDYKGIEKLAEAGSRVPRRRSNPDLKAQFEKGGLLAPIKVDKKLEARSKECLPSLERDPQEDPPAWMDFFIAVFYICFGVVALFAGLLSLAASDDK